MKHFLCGWIMWWMAAGCFAQPTSISIATDKTVSLIFPFSIRHIDRGSPDVLVEKVPTAEDVLLLKAGHKNFGATNLSVLTSDGNVYTFALSYAMDPTQWVYKLSPLSGETIETYAKGILDNPRIVHGIKAENWGVAAAVIGIYIKGETLYCHLSLQNSSAIDYDIDGIRFYVRDKKKMKRTASQEIELKPKLLVGNTTKVRSGLTSEAVAALPKFTIPDKKFLQVAITEKEGGRNLLLKVSNRKIIKAKKIRDYQ